MERDVLHIQQLKEFFGNKECFQAEDLFTFYQTLNPAIPKSTVNWRINSLVKAKVIHRIGWGTYKFGSGNSFLPQISEKTLKINSLMKSCFPYLKYLIWHVGEINFLSQHLINKDTYYVEVEREAIDAVFEQLRDKFKYVLRGKSNDDVYFGESVIIVRSLVSGSPVQVINDVPAMTIEKLLVDLFVDKEFEFLQGYELINIFDNAFTKYTINIDKLLRYASRKAKRAQIAAFIKTIK